MPSSGRSWAARCAAPTVDTEAVPSFRRGRSQTGPPTTDQLSPARPSQALLWDRTSCNFGEARPQWAGKKRGPPLRFCAPEIMQNLTGTRPPAILWVLSHRWESTSPPAGGEIPLQKTPFKANLSAQKKRPAPRTPAHQKDQPSPPGYGYTGMAQTRPRF